MKFRKLNNWDTSSSCKGLLYFAQLFEELLFDYSLDTYKPSVMHTGLLCEEALNTIDEITNGNIQLPNIWHVTEELCNSFEKDLVAQSLISIPKSTFFPILKNKTKTLNELRTVLDLLSFNLSGSRYRKKNEELLIKEIIDSQSYPVIRRLSRSYLTTLIAQEYHPKYIYENCINYFFKNTKRINNPEFIKDFLQLFSAEKLDYTVIFRVDATFAGLLNVFSNFDLLITEKLPDGIELSKYHTFNQLPKDNFYAIVEKVKVHDIYSARSYAEELLEFISTLHSIFHHKKNLNWQNDCVVFDKKNLFYKKITKPANSMQKCSDLIPPVANNRLRLLLKKFSLEEDSFSKFIRSVQLHSMALTSNADENQILNLWISLESLIPSETKKEDISNIEHIANSLIPFLNINYIESLLNNLIKYLLRWNRPFITEILKKIDGQKKLTHRIAMLLILPQYKSVVENLDKQLDYFFLLRDRINYFCQVLSSPSNVLNILDAHKIRLEWQIRRIYRARNIIVHSGDTPPYTKSLIEHTHSYLDTVLSTLVNLASKPRIIFSVAQGFKLIELSYYSYYKALSEKGLSFNDDNIDSLLFFKIKK